MELRGDMRRWNEYEHNYIKKNYKNMAYQKIVDHLNRSIDSIKQYVSRNLPVRNRSEVGKIGNKAMKKKYNHDGENNPNWKGGISTNNYHYKKIQKERYPERVKAREQVYCAIKSGKLIKKPCVVCGDRDSCAHHEDYAKPLCVVWLCRKHHRERHRDCH